MSSASSSGSPSGSSVVAHLALLASTALWGSSFLAMKVAVEAYGPILTIFLRLSLAAVLFWLARRSVWQPLRRLADLPWIVLMALFEPGLYYLFEGHALQLTTSAQAGTVAAMLPLMLAMAARVVLGEHLTRATALGFGLSTVGVVVLTLGSHSQETAPNPVLGNFLEFLAMVCATGYMITLKRLSPYYGPWFLTAAQAVVGTVFFLPLALASAGGDIHPAAGWWPAVAVVYLGTAISVGAYGLYNLGMSQLPANRAAGYINLIPVVAVLLGWQVLGESIAPVQWLATLLVLAGVWYSQMGLAARV